MTRIHTNKRTHIYISSFINWKHKPFFSLYFNTNHTILIFSLYCIIQYNTIYKIIKSTERLKDQKHGNKNFSQTHYFNRSIHKSNAPNPVQDSFPYTHIYIHTHSYQITPNT